MYFNQKRDPIVRNAASSLKLYVLYIYTYIYIYARSIRYATEFSPAVRERARFNELLIFSQKHRSPTAISLIARGADNLINFQAVDKKRLSKLELLSGRPDSCVTLRHVGT